MILGNQKSVALLLNIADHKRVKEALQKSYYVLDRRVKDRTNALAETNFFNSLKRNPAGAYRWQVNLEAIRSQRRQQTTFQHP